MQLHRWKILAAIAVLNVEAASAQVSFGAWTVEFDGGFGMLDTIGYGPTEQTWVSLALTCRTGGGPWVLGLVGPYGFANTTVTMWSDGGGRAVDTFWTFEGAALVLGDNMASFELALGMLFLPDITLFASVDGVTYRVNVEHFEVAANRWAEGCDR